MNYKQTYDLIGNVDIYIIDQILKGRYQPGESILDAGCGSGRNLKWFYQNYFTLAGIDADAERIAQAKENYPDISKNFTVGNLDSLSFGESAFDHILCSAVLHFAQSREQFDVMFSQLVRVLKPEGTLFIRVASDIGLDGKKPWVQDGISKEAGNFYVTRRIISELLQSYPLKLIEPVKTTNVQDLRAMTTLVFQKF
ncbi:class I SAM-dependent methyltransferase [Cryomorpha ignava]|uniref:Class I SAM-dependent methyltransferase n=1 Tax=Cryomorpha ignava TaxID=101383 RepID=A0A7K3WRV7_9FLAO|nr:class I SAM-dependent methyltransferase [Cryomorpha ignava]NEN24258.1 class I SAM-dependent methyltransferase [Cryomorpha ignava]